MAVGALTSAGVYVAELDASPYVNDIASPLSIDMLDASNVASGGYSLMVPGMRHGKIVAKGFQDFTNLFPTVGDADRGVSTLFSVVPNGSSATVGDPAVFCRGPISAIDQGDGKVGELAAFSVENDEDAAFVLGNVAHPLAQRSTTASGTAFALTGPTATQALYAGVHVTQSSGGNFTLRIQSDDNIGMASPTTRITFSTVAVAGWQFTSVAGSFSSETHVRADWTISAGTVTFVAVVGVVSLV